MRSLAACVVKPMKLRLQAPVRLRQRQLVVGQREVVHADVNVAGAGQPFDRELRSLSFASRTGSLEASIGSAP
jgi:hypothetical protein